MKVHSLKNNLKNFKLQSKHQCKRKLRCTQKRAKCKSNYLFYNANASAWRDKARAIDSADFDPEFLVIDKERRKKFFIERYEQPKKIRPLRIPIY